MRIFVKNQLLGIVEVLKEAHDYLRTFIVSKQHAEAIEVLATCQDGAVAIGTTMEQSGQPVEECIRVLESYCEQLYYISQNVQNAQYNIQLAYRVLDEQVSYVEQFIRERLNVTYEIVFLPYKASMWDSMESVWRAAKQDPNCECYVIPIPYYEKTMGSSVSTMVYEGAVFPDDVPITPYEQYNIEERKPDIIYIHNPYDEYNLVTSVHPTYYSYQLKKHTQMLVYIPYYVTGGSIPEIHTTFPVYKYADKIVIQSNHLKKVFRSNVPERKLVALGSPKVDKIVELHRKPRQVPPEWEPVICDRKVIFFNTSLSELLEHGEKSLKKMWDVFSFFRMRAREVLLWRPHPLSKSTLKAMRSSLYEQYCALEQTFLNEKIGILDTTPDVSMSVAISDAYIGDPGSSVVHLFGVAGKPIFLLNSYVEVDRAGAKKLIGCLDAHIEDGKAWFVHSHYNALCEMDLQTGSVAIIGRIPNEPDNVPKLYHDVIKVDNKLYFSPSLAREILEYDLQTGSFRKIPFKNLMNDKTNFSRMVRYKNNLYFLPTNHSSLMRYNLKTRSLKYYNIFHEVIKREPKGKEPMEKFIGAMMIEGNLLLMASCQTNAVIEFNMDTEEKIVHRVGSDHNTFYRMDYDGKDYWFIPHESRSIVRWNRLTGKTIEYDQFPEGFEGDKNAFLQIIHCDDYMLVFPKTANMILKIEIESGQISEFKLPLPYREGERKENYYKWPNNYYFAKKIDESHVLALTAYNSSILIINIKTQECRIQKCEIKKGMAVQFIRCSANLPYASQETELTWIEEFLMGIEDHSVFQPEAQKAAYAAVIDNMDGTSGIKIHQYIIDQLKSHSHYQKRQ